MFHCYVTQHWNKHQTLMHRLLGFFSFFFSVKFFASYFILKVLIQDNALFIFGEDQRSSESLSKLSTSLSANPSHIMWRILRVVKYNFPLGGKNSGRTSYIIISQVLHCLHLITVSNNFSSVHVEFMAL